MNIKREQVFVWSRNVRLFHWINVITITLLVMVGLIILNSKLLGISSDGKVLLKIMHVSIGYIFAINFLFRIFIGFFGKAHEQWRKAIAFENGLINDLKAFKQHKVSAYKGHNPAGKLMIMVLLFFMSVQLISGLVIAGTDIYFPPFGKYFAQSIAIDKTNLEVIQPYSKKKRR